MVSMRYDVLIASIYAGIKLSQTQLFWFKAIFAQKMRLTFLTWSIVVPCGRIDTILGISRLEAKLMEDKKSVSWNSPIRRCTHLIMKHYIKLLKVTRHWMSKLTNSWTICHISNTGSAFGTMIWTRVAHEWLTAILHPDSKDPRVDID